jgi:N-methylhydantoinase A
MTTPAPGRGLRIGADIGGTFTDLVFLWPDGRFERRKLSSTPDDLSRAIGEGIAAWCAERGVDGTGVAELVHATTVATNAILERRGAKTALITTEGFRDILEFRRIRIPMSNDLAWEKPPPLVRRALRLPVRERIDARGDVLVPLDLDSLEPALTTFRAEGVESVAVCLLHAWRDATHEQAVGRWLRARMPGTWVSLSNEVLPELLEFERTSTTVVDAYVGPLIGRYLGILHDRMASAGIDAPLLVMQSNGGLIGSGSATRRAVSIIESGPAAGVVACARLARACGYADLITLDMGGTTTKASIIEKGELLRASEYEVGGEVSIASRLVRGGGYLLKIPVIDVSEIGAGGGSIAALDSGGALRVGPRSAGSVPGPACYGQGNTRPTVTDANVVLGYIGAGSLAGGSVRIDRELAERAVSGIGERIGKSSRDTAHGIHLIANANMVRAIKSVSVQRGRDPADFTLVAFGGAGPLHAVGVARELGMRRVLVPPAPGVFSAVGLLRAEVEHHAASTVLAGTGTLGAESLAAVLAQLRAELSRRIEEDGFDPARASFSGSADLRYRGQSSELGVALPGGEISEATLRALERDFEREYERTYGHRGNRDVELVTCRMIATVERNTGSTALNALHVPAGDSGREREVYFGEESGGTTTVPVLGRAELAGRQLSGALLVQEYDTTIVVPPGCTTTLDGFGNVLVELVD